MNLENKLKVIPDFPKKGVNFLDISPLLLNSELFRQLIFDLGQRAEKFDFDKIVAVESRGFVLGSPLAFHLNKGFVMIRKKGKLPGETISQTYDLEYGTDSIEMGSEIIKKDEKILVLDDILATGGTAKAACELVEKTGGCITACLFFIELAFLGGRRILNYPTEALVVRDS